MGSVTTERQGKVAVLRLDDGKANAISPALLEALNAALDAAEKDANAVMVIGRPGRLSAGFDLKVMGGGDREAARALVGGGGELLMRLFEFPLPVVMACPGHAIAAGALLLLASDLRIGADVDAKIGLNEVAIGMALPVFATELARARLSKRHFLRATAQAEMYGPREAVDAGYLDEVVAADALEARALAEATRLAELQQPAFRLTKRGANGAIAAGVRETLEADLTRMFGS